MLFLVFHITIISVNQVHNVLSSSSATLQSLQTSTLLIYPSHSSRYHINNNRHKIAKDLVFSIFCPPVCFKIKYVKTQSGISVINIVHSQSPVTIQFGYVNAENDDNKAEFTKGWNNVCF